MSSRAKQLRAALVVGAVTLAVAAPVLAYRYDGDVWANATTHMLLSTSSFPVGSAELTMIEDSLEAWHAVQGCAFRFTHQPSASSGATDHNDRRNGVAFSSQVGDGTLGITFSTDFTNGERASADVLFNNRTNWSFDGSPAWNQYDLGSTARHEFGHALGLNHSNLGCNALMGSGCGGNGVVRHITADDAAGARFLYPGAPTAPPPNWRGRISATPLSVRAGGTLQVTVVAENAGAGPSSRLPERLVVLSTNSWISDQDRELARLAAQTTTVGAGQSRTATLTVTIPAGTTPGSYWLGLFVDPATDVDESSDDDNTASVQVAVTTASSPTPPAPTPPAPTPPAPTPVPNPPLPNTPPPTPTPPAPTPPAPTPPAPTPPPAPPPADWVVSRLIVSPPQVVTGGAISVQVALTNAGAEAPSRPEVRLLLSDNATISVRDAALASDGARPGVFARGAEVILVFDLPSLAATPGDWFVGAIVDPDGLDAEAREDNNTASGALVVLPLAATPAPAPAPAPAPSPAPAPTPPATVTPAASAAPVVAAPQTAASGGGGGGGCSLAPAADARSSGSAPALLGLALAALLVARRRRGSE